MEVSEVLQQKAKAEVEIKEILDRFSAETGCRIEYVNINVCERLGAPPRYFSSLDVRIQ